MHVSDYTFVADEGTLVLFAGTDEATGDRVTFGVDHRMAQPLLDPETDIELLDVEDWAVLRREPASGHWFVFLNRRRDLMKILYWDGTGFCIWAKKFES